MYVAYRLVVGFMKAFFRLPLDLTIEILSFLRNSIAPNLKDYIFISNLENLDRFTMSPGDLVMCQKHYEELTSLRGNVEPEVVIGTVIGYDIKWCKVLVSFFNPSEANKPIVKRYYESELKLLKSSLNELFLQGKIYQALEKMQEGELILPQEEDDPLDSLVNTIKDKDKDENDDENNGGGMVH